MFRMACEPGTLNPSEPGNPTYMSSEARDRANLLIKPLQRAGFVPPSPATLDNESLREWFRFLGTVRIELG